MRNNQDSYIRQSDYCHKYDKKSVELQYLIFEKSNKVENEKKI